MGRPLLLALAMCLFAVSSTEISYAHLTGGQTKVVSDYRVQFDTDPFHPTTKTNTTLRFSIQDLGWLSRWNVTASISIIKDGVTVHSYPKQRYVYGDFNSDYFFEKDGSYKLVLEIYDSHSSEPLRVEFDFTVYQESFVSIMDNLMIVAFVGTLGVFGFLAPYLVMRKLWR